MTQAEQEALALLRIGRSFEEAAAFSGLEVKTVIALWRALQRQIEEAGDGD